MELAGIRFLNPVFLYLLIAPAFLLVVWIFRFWTRRGDIARYSTYRIVPTKERYVLGGKNFAWLYLILALALSALAMTRPQYIISVSEDSPIDVIVILDGSASSRVADVEPDRWQRSVAWLKTFVGAMRWDGDRLALAVFARRASPFVRITSDSNVVMFFLEHLDKEPSIPLTDNTAWDTNIEEAIYWGLRLVDKDKELYGESGNPKAFILVSDGQAWSGEARIAITNAVKARIPIFVIGVGTDTGGFIPAPILPGGCYWDEESEQQICTESHPDETYTPIHSSIDRSSLQRIASAGRGRYFELDRMPDGEIAASIINAFRLQSFERKTKESFAELYWECMCGAMLFIGLSMFFLFKQ